MAALARIGAGGGVCYAAGFAEVGDESGRSLEADLAAVVGDFALVGPNANGILNHLDGVALWPVESHRPQRVERGVAVISQSGTVAFHYIRNRRSVHAAYVVSVGNQRFVDVADIMAVVLDDPRVTAIGLFLEGITDVVAFSDAAAQAAEQGVPIVALKAGRTEVGARMALTHTASLAGGDELYQALFDRLGIARVRTLDEFDEALKMTSIGGCRPGRQVRAITMCGAFRTLFADAADDNSLVLPAPSAATSGELTRQLHEFATVSNVLDYNPPYTGMDVLSLENYDALALCFGTFLSDPHDVGVMIDNFDDDVQSGADVATPPALRAWMELPAAPATPRVVVSGLSDRFSERFREECISNRVVPLQGIEAGARAIAAAAWVGRRWEELAGAPPASWRLTPRRGSRAAAPRVLDEWQSKRLLEAHGLPLPHGECVHGGDAAAAAVRVDFPVVVKAVSSAVVHKARVGGVVLDVRSTTGVEAAVTDIRARYASIGVTVDEFLVEEMVPEILAELLVGVTVDERFGAALVLGRGGSDVELLDDVESVLLPAVPGDLLRVCQRLVERLGLPPESLPAIHGAVEAVAGCAVELSDDLAELDVNPLIVHARGVVAVDAVVSLRQRSTDVPHHP